MTINALKMEKTITFDNNEFILVLFFSSIAWVSELSIPFPIPKSETVKKREMLEIKMKIPYDSVPQFLIRIGTDKKEITRPKTRLNINSKLVFFLNLANLFR